MADTATYDKIATTTLGSAASSITFSSIAASWTDLRLVIVGFAGSSGQTLLTFNGDGATNYSRTILDGNGSGAGSDSTTGQTYINLHDSGSSSTIPGFYDVNIFSYANATYKTILSSGSEDANGSGRVSKTVGLWRNTAAITSLTIKPNLSNTFGTGTTATLYGIRAA